MGRVKIVFVTFYHKLTNKLYLCISSHPYCILIEMIQLKANFGCMLFGQSIHQQTYLSLFTEKALRVQVI